jgi:hypothetical protein
MEHGSDKLPFFDGTNYPYWKIHISVYLQGIDWQVWEICEDPNYEVLVARVGQEQIDPLGHTTQIARLIVFSFRVFRFLNLKESLIVLLFKRSG